ncbi:MAG: methylated-DNA--[protein]-cysteine S-methyltransferase [Thermodesulfobacteriota bacterium]
MDIISYSNISTSVGEIFIISAREGITNLIFGEERFIGFKKNLNAKLLVEGGRAEESAKELELYFDGRLKHFKGNPVALLGTPFQVLVWKGLVQIPYGQVVSYNELAKRIGKPNSARAVGNAVGANPIPIIVPCHRVISSRGLGGYSSGIEIKKKLLRLEGSIV